ncbi:MAG TPA: hypothetical protein VFV38_19435 [Ktedonobacteraceae bacterium]|nr:hypothetical protein [Ktedonobacteraceae bacterium]
MSSSSNTAPKGGFVQGIPQVSALPVRDQAPGGCCGSTDHSSNTGCCGEPVTQAPASAPTTQGCCGEPAVTSTAAARATGCCGEPVTRPLGAGSAAQSGCCN